MTPAAGKLDHSVTLQNYRETRSASGAQVRAYEAYAIVWARVRTLSGTERIAAQQASSILTHEVTIRYRSDVRPDHRLVLGIRAFDIKDVRNVDERNEELRMLVTEVLSAGPSSSSSPSASPSASASASA